MRCGITVVARVPTPRCTCVSAPSMQRIAESARTTVWIGCACTDKKSLTALFGPSGSDAGQRLDSIAAA